MEMLIYQKKMCQEKIWWFFSWNLQIAPSKKHIIPQHHQPWPARTWMPRPLGNCWYSIQRPQPGTNDITTLNPDGSFSKGNRIPETGGISCFFFCRCLFSDVVLKVNRMMIQRKTGMNTQKGKTRLVQSLDVLVCRFFCTGVGNLWILEVLPSF